MSDELRDYLEARRARLLVERADDAAMQFASMPLLGGTDAPPHNGTTTSKAAALRVAPTWSARKVKVMEVLINAEQGMTRADLVTAIPMPENSVNSCVRSLLDHGDLVEAGERDGRHILFHPRFVREEKAA